MDNRGEDEHEEEWDFHLGTADDSSSDDENTSSNSPYLRSENQRKKAKTSEVRLSKCIDDAFAVPDAEAELAGKSTLELVDAAIALWDKSALLQRGLRRSIEASAEASAIREKKMAEEISSLKAQLAAKEQERISCVETVYKMESSLITVSKRLETRVEELERVKKDLEKSEKERSYLKKKLDEKDAFVFRSANRVWELSRDCLDQFAAKPEAACWEEGDFSSFFSWLFRQYDDLPMVLQTTADLSCMYSTRALFHLMREANDPLYAKLLDEGYKFPPVESLSKVSTRTNNELGKKYFHQYWNSGGREHAFAIAKARLEKQLEKAQEEAAEEAALKRAKTTDDARDHPV